jgi:hypothetical protein
MVERRSANYGFGLPWVRIYRQSVALCPHQVGAGVGFGAGIGQAFGANADDLHFWPSMFIAEWGQPDVSTARETSRSGIGLWFRTKGGLSFIKAKRLSARQRKRGG